MKGDANGALAHAQAHRDFGGAPSLEGDLLDDTTLAIGPNHVFDWVNLSAQIFDKSGNDLSGGPFNGTSFWQDLGGDCANVNGGDIIVIYDHLPDRWMVTQLAAAIQGRPRPPALRHCRSRVSNASMSLCGMLWRSARPWRMPSCTLAWTSSSWNTMSSRCGRVEKIATLAV